MRHPFLLLSSLLGLTGLSEPARAGENYVYHRDGWGEAGTTQVELESAYGTREVRPFGEEGLENGLRLRYRPSDALQLEAWGGMLVQDGAVQAPSFSVEAGMSVLKQENQGVNLTVGAGYRRDFAGVSVPGVRLTAGRNIGRWNLTGSARAEKPLAEDRDAVDVMVGLAAGVEVRSGMAVNVELQGEDLEGFWEEEEAEGGARLVAGPGLVWHSSPHFSLRAHVGATVVASREETGALQPGVGGLGRLTLGYQF